MIYAIVRQRPPTRNRIHPDRQTIRDDSDWTHTNIVFICKRTIQSSIANSSEIAESLIS